MSMTPAQLMMPRIKVIAPYPSMAHEVGTILTFEKEGCTKGLLITSEYSAFGGLVDVEHNYPLDTFLSYPHLFRKLEWHEDRKPEDMPEYLKHGNNGKPRKVTAYTSVFVVFDGGKTRRLNSRWLPATLDEYEQFKAQS